MVQELGRFDAEYLKENTNAPYLVGLDGYFVKDENGKAQVWDPVSKSARPHDDPELKDSALTDDYAASEVQCRPAFQIFKDKLREYTRKKHLQLRPSPQRQSEESRKNSSVRRKLEGPLSSKVKFIHCDQRPFSGIEERILATTVSWIISLTR